jgi:hypothetical protein
MTQLHTLNRARNRFSASAFEWIAEGCPALTALNVQESAEFDDTSLALIGEKCGKLRRLHLSKCFKVSDFGIEMFMQKFTGRLQFLDLSNNLDLSGESMASLARGAEEFEEVRLNGVGRILNPGTVLCSAVQFSAV